VSGDFASDYVETPYWWDRSPPASPSGTELPQNADVVVVGSGYTGLHAAIACARAGLSTVVLERDALGAGCSTRNGGQISTSIKPSFAALAARHGGELAQRLYASGRDSRTHVADFIAREAIDCDHRSDGRFVAAHSIRAYRRLEASLRVVNPVHDDGDYLVPPERQGEQIGSERYVGGLVNPLHAALDPGRYHAGCVAVARAAGVTLVDFRRATRLQDVGNGTRVHTLRGCIDTRRVIIATNGYTDALVPTLRRRIIPIGSYVIATEAIAPDLLDALLPTQRMLCDTRRVVYYYRRSPDNTRIVFGGRVSLAETDYRRSGKRLLDELRRLFPALHDVRITHSWSGSVAYTFDALAHRGEHGGVHYAMGYCGSGVGMAGFSGAAVGQAVVNALLGSAVPVAPTNLPFPTRPLYNGKPWFLAPSIAGYRLLDRLGV